MERIELLVDSGSEPAGSVDELSSRVPEQKEEWLERLGMAAAGREESLRFPAYVLSERPSKNFQVIGMLLKTIQLFGKEHEYPKTVVLACLSEDDATMYRQVYNFYIPNTKDERMNAGLWD